MPASKTAPSSILPRWPTVKTEAIGREYCRRKARTKGQEMRAKVMDSWRHKDSPCNAVGDSARMSAMRQSDRDPALERAMPGNGIQLGAFGRAEERGLKSRRRFQ